MQEQCTQIHYQDVSLFLKQKNSAKVLVLIHGGKASRERAKTMCEDYLSFFPEWSLISVDYRFSGFGGQELDDVIKGIKYAHSLSPSKVYVLGESHGGYLALMAGARTKIEGIIDAYCLTDLIAMKEYSEKGNPELSEDWQDYIQATLKECHREKIALNVCLQRRSPVFWAAQIKARVLILHGTADGIVPIEQSERLVEEFKHLGKKNFQFIPLIGYAHGFSLLEGQVYQIIRDFLHASD